MTQRTIRDKMDAKTKQKCNIIYCYHFDFSDDFKQPDYQQKLIFFKEFLQEYYASVYLAR